MEAAKDERQFPLLGRENEPGLRTIPWAMLAGHEARARNNHGAGLEMLARRGGLSVDEALAVIENRDIATVRRDPQGPVKLSAHLERWRREIKMNGLA